MSETSKEVHLDLENPPTPKSVEELAEYIKSLTVVPEGAVGYNYTAETLVMGALAAFNFLAHHHGCTGFQAGWAALNILGQIQGYKGPFGVIDGSNLLYPQYDLHEKLEGWIQDWTKNWAAAEAKKLLAERVDGDLAPHPSVEAHWRKLAAMAPTDSD